MADKIYQKRNGQLVEVSAGGSFAGSLPAATASSLGGVIVGSGLTVDSSGKVAVSGGYVSGIASSYVASGGYTISGNVTVTGTLNGTATSAASASNAAKVNNLTVSTAVPANAKFTDTTYAVFGAATASANGTSGLVPAPVSGQQAFLLQGNKSWINPSTLTVSSAAVAANAAKVNNLTVSTAVPANAKFTDTVYTHPTHTAKAAGLYKVTVDSLGHVTAAAAVTKADITALGIPGSDTNTTYAAFTGATASSAGAAGLVPKPASNYQGRVLGGGGSWIAPSTLTVSSATVATSAGTCTGTAAKATALTTASAYTVDNVQSAVTLPSGGTWFYMAWANSSPMTKVGSGAGGAVVYSKGKAPAATVSEEQVRSVRVVAFRKA